MSNERKPQQPDDEPRREKQTMTEPQEEFIGDVPPSKDISEVKPGEKAPPSSSDGPR